MPVFNGGEMEIKGFLFDFDGVIANTMEVNFACWRDTFAKYNYDLDKERYFLLEGMGTKNIAEIFIDEIEGPRPTWKEIAVNKNALFLKRFNQKIYPEIFPILDILEKKQIPFAIVTGSDKHRLEGAVDKEFLSRFNAYVTVDDTARPKPNPDPYLKGAELIDIDPASCVVVENAPAGLTAGKKTGAFTIGILTTLSRSDLEEADLIFDDHRALLNWIEENVDV